MNTCDTNTSKPDTYLVWALIGITFCLPFGLLALVEAIKVDSLYSDGEYDEAIMASENAKKWSMWCLWSWLIFFGLLLLFVIIAK